MRYGFGAISILLSLLIISVISVFMLKTYFNTTENLGTYNASIEKHVDDEVKKIEEFKKIQNDYLKETLAH